LSLIQKTADKCPAKVLFGREIFRERWINNKSTTEEIAKKKYLMKTKFQIGEEVLVKVETRTNDLKVLTK